MRGFAYGYGKLLTDDLIISHFPSATTEIETGIVASTIFNNGASQADKNVTVQAKFRKSVVWEKETLTFPIPSSAVRAFLTSFPSEFHARGFVLGHAPPIECTTDPQVAKDIEKYPVGEDPFTHDVLIF